MVGFWKYFEGFVVVLDIKRERKKIKNDPRIFGVNYQFGTFGVTINQMKILQIMQIGEESLIVGLKCPSDT